MCRIDNKIYALTVLLLALFMASCSGDGKEEEGEKPNPFQLEEGAEVSPVSVKRLDLDIAGYVDADSTVRQQIISDNYEDLWYYGQFADNVDTVDNVVMLTWSASPVITDFAPDVKKRFPTSQLKKKPWEEFCKQRKKTISIYQSTGS